MVAFGLWGSSGVATQPPDVQAKGAREGVSIAPIILVLPEYRAEAMNRVGRAVEWWRKQANVTIEVREPVFVDDPPDFLVDGEVPSDPCMGAWRSRVSESRGADVRLVLGGLIRRGATSWLLGRACDDRGNEGLCDGIVGGEVLAYAGVDIGGPSTDVVVAHELGHLFGLGHPDRPCSQGLSGSSVANLMGQAVHEGLSTSPLEELVLEDDQVSYVRRQLGSE